MFYKNKTKTNKNLGFTILELVIVLFIISLISTLIYNRGKRYIENNAAEADKLKIVLSINNANIDSLNENINRKIAFNTDDINYKKGIYVYKLPVNGVGGGFEQDAGSNYQGSIFSQQPVPNVTFECEKPNAAIKGCPVFIFGTATEPAISYGTGNTLPLPTVTSSKGKIYKFETNGDKASITFVSYTFDAGGYPRNRIFFNSYYSTLQIYVYKYIGGKDATAPTRDEIATYHQDRMNLYYPDKDPDWEREKYYAIPLKVEI